jgi:hypothetical protein
MTRPTNFGRGIANQSASGLGGSIEVPDASDADFDNTDADLPGDPATIQDAIDALADLWAAGYPRPLMAFDPDLDMWFVVVDGDGTAVMVTGGP